MRLVDNIIFIIIQITIAVCWINANWKMGHELKYGNKGVALLQFFMLNGMMLYLTINVYSNLTNFSALINWEYIVNQIVVGIMIFCLLVYIILINGHIGIQLLQKNKEGQASVMLTTVFVLIVVTSLVFEVDWRFTWII